MARLRECLPRGGAASIGAKAFVSEERVERGSVGVGRGVGRRGLVGLLGKASVVGWCGLRGDDGGFNWWGVWGDVREKVEKHAGGRVEGCEDGDISGSSGAQGFHGCQNQGVCVW